MFEIQGKVNTAVCFATVIEQSTVDQIRRMCNYPVAEGSKIRIMPDAHFGKGCTIGTTMTIIDKAVPNIVGVDIGCGMYTVNLGKGDIDFAKVDEAAHYIPSGRRVWEGRQVKFDLTELRCYRLLKDSKRLERSIGTLGGGNHFIEIDMDPETGNKYLVIHSGSRNLGTQVASLYQKLAIELAKGKEAYYDQRDEIIRTYKEQGREDEIQAAIKAIRWEKHEAECPNDLCYVYGTYLEDYLHDVEICQRFARRNREVMAGILMERSGLMEAAIAAGPVPGTDDGRTPGFVGETDGAAGAGGNSSVAGFHTVHNYIDTEERILRKGAIAAHEGEMVLIPLNMRDGSILARGKGNPDWNYSAPHGAGRLMSRTQAKQQLDMDEYRASMAGIYTTSVGRGTLDEAPMAYKSYDAIIGDIADAVDITATLKPIYNFKASD